MPTECSADLFGFAPVEGREMVAGFDGGAIISDAGSLLLCLRRPVVGAHRYGYAAHGARL
jgi:hypothetical protein